MSFGVTFGKEKNTPKDLFFRVSFGVSFFDKLRSHPQIADSDKVWQRCPRHFGGEWLPQHRTVWAETWKLQDLVTENRGSELEIELTGLGILSSPSCAKFEGKFLWEKLFVPLSANFLILKVFDLTWGWILLVVMCYICSRTPRYVTKPLPLSWERNAFKQKTTDLPISDLGHFHLHETALSTKHGSIRTHQARQAKCRTDEGAFHFFERVWDTEPNQALVQWYETVIFDGWWDSR